VFTRSRSALVSTTTTCPTTKTTKTGAQEHLPSVTVFLSFFYLKLFFLVTAMYVPHVCKRLNLFLVSFLFESQRRARFPSSSWYSRLWQVIFDDQPTRDHSVQQKKIATIRTFSFLHFFPSHSSLQNERSSASTATASPINVSTSTVPSPHSQSPAPSTSVLLTHARRPSALVQGIRIKA
jgi:hypothetical protein